jgi:hypothetical protein
MSEFIALTEAVGMTRDFKTNRETILGTGYQNQDLLPFNETFEKDKIIDMLNNSGCVGMRLYYGMDSGKKIHALLVGIDSEGKDILPENDDPGNYILERSNRVPPGPTPPSSPLNS